tara:strand:- start:466 stop:1296 length:831 start_codon:yes stop_codon:yes gene_type:complete
VGEALTLLLSIQSELNKTPSSLATLALIVSWLEYEDLDIQDELDSFNQLHSVLVSRLKKDSPILEKLNEISEYLFFELGFSGDVDNYYDPKNSFINEVLNRRKGIPITLAILYMELASRLGIIVEGIGMPGHFLVGAYDESEKYYVDVFNKGIVVNKEECMAMFDSRASKALAWDDRYLSSVDNRYIISRLLRNLKYIYLNDSRNIKAYEVIDILVGLEPDNVFEIRDRGMIGFRVGQHKQSVIDLKKFLEKEPVGRSAVEASSVLELLERNLKRW